MRHRYAGRKLNVTTAHRKAIMRNMVTSLFEHERIVTTDARAKELRILADRMVTLPNGAICMHVAKLSPSFAVSP